MEYKFIKSINTQCEMCNQLSGVLTIIEIIIDNKKLRFNVCPNCSGELQDFIEKINEKIKECEKWIKK